MAWRGYAVYVNCLKNEERTARLNAYWTALSGNMNANRIL